MMKCKLTLLLAIFLSGPLFSQTLKAKKTPTIGLLFNYSTPKQHNVCVTSAIRSTYPVYKKISVGAEFNYTQQFGRDGNSDYVGGIAFARINPYQGFIGELGYSVNQRISSTRTYTRATRGIYASVGYQVKLNKRWAIELQYRALPLKYLENGIVNSKLYLLGINYNFK